MISVLLIGEDPSLVVPNDPSDPTAPGGITPDVIAQSIKDGLSDMRDRGWHADFCSIMLDENTETVITDYLSRASWDVVVVGAGVRRPPDHLEVFERVIAAVRKGAPDAEIAFNMIPSDSTAAALRALERRR